MVDPRTPILVGGAQFTQRTARQGKVAESLSPIAMMAKVAREAMADAGAGDKLAAALDTIAVVRFTADSPGDQGRLPRRTFRNPGRPRSPGILKVLRRGGISTRRPAGTRRNGW